MKYFFQAFLLAVSLIVVGESHAVSDIRFCGEPQRDDKGQIIRSQKVLHDFQRLYACPSTGLHAGACPGWAKDHVVSLDCGGCDSIENLQWLPDDIKSSSNPHAKDRWERKVYYPSSDLPGTGNCKFEVVK
jgi:hypothetical protein